MTVVTTWEVWTYAIRHGGWRRTHPRTYPGHDGSEMVQIGDCKIELTVLDGCASIDIQDVTNTLVWREGDGDGGDALWVVEAEAPIELYGSDTVCFVRYAIDKWPLGKLVCTSHRSLSPLRPWDNPKVKVDVVGFNEVHP